MKMWKVNNNANDADNGQIVIRKAHSSPRLRWAKTNNMKPHTFLIPVAQICSSLTISAKWCSISEIILKYYNHKKTFHIMSFLFLKVICLRVLYNLRVSCLFLFTICKSYKGSSFIMRYSENLSEDYIYFKQEKLWIVKFLVPIQDKESYIRLMVVYWIQPPLKFCIFIDVTISGEWNSLDYTKRLWPLENWSGTHW